MGCIENELLCIIHFSIAMLIMYNIQIINFSTHYNVTFITKGRVATIKIFINKNSLTYTNMAGEIFATNGTTLYRRLWNLQTCSTLYYDLMNINYYMSGLRTPVML